MVQLRVDVEAANARRAFEQAADAVDNLTDELDAAEDAADQARDAFDQAADEVNRLEREVQQTDRRLEELRSTARAMGNMMPATLRQELRDTERASRDLHRQLDRTVDGARQLGRAANQAEDNVARLADELDDATRQARQLERQLNDLDADASRSMRSVQRGLLGVASGAGLAGGNAGKAFAAGMANAPVAAAAAGLVAVIGGAVNGALLGAFGGGVVAAGVAIAAKKSDVVQQAFRDSFAPMRRDVTEFALFFEDELIGSAARFGNVWDSVGDDVSSLFAQAQHYVQPLADGLGALVEKVAGGDGLAAAVEAAGPVLSEMGEGLSQTGDALDSFFDSLADGGDGAVKGMIVIFALLTGGIRAAGNVIEFLSRTFDVATDAAQGYSEVMETMLGWIPGVGDAWSWAADKLDLFNNEGGKTRDLMPIVGAGAEDAAEGIYRTEDAAKKAAKAAHDLSKELSDLVSDQLDATQAAIAWEESLDQLTESVKENGRNIDIGTEKGRANQRAVLDAVAAAEQKRQKDIELAGGEKASAAAVESANAAFRAQIGQLEQNLLKMGFTKAQVDQLLGSYKNLAAAPNITKSITIRVGTVMSSSAASMAAALAGVQPRAGGGPVRAGQPYLVGEQGQELFVPNHNGTIINAAETARMMSASGGGRAAGAAGGVLQAQLVSTGGYNDWFSQALAHQIRTGGVRLVVVNGEVRVG